MTPVDVFVRDTSLAKRPVPGALVRIYAEDGRVLWTESRTDDQGRAGFLLPEGLRYQARFFCASYGFQNPQFFVVTAGETNAFDVTADVLEVDMPTDPRLCHVRGVFRDSAGRRRAGISLELVPQFSTLWVDGTLVLADRIRVLSGPDGVVLVPLLRFGKYDVEVGGFEGYARAIAVPDAPTANLIDLLFPVVDRVVFLPAGPYTLSLSSSPERVVIPTVVWSDGREVVGSAPDDVQYGSSDPSVLAVLLTPLNLTLRALGPGTAAVTVRRRDSRTVRLPDPGLALTPMTVEVLP